MLHSLTIDSVHCFSKWCAIDDEYFSTVPIFLNLYFHNKKSASTHKKVTHALLNTPFVFSGTAVFYYIYIYICVYAMPA